MKRNSVRLIALLLMLCMMLPLVAACDKKEPPADEKTMLVSNGFTIIYAAAEDECAASAALLFREAVRGLLGFRPEVSTDRAFRGDINAQPVLLIGNVTLIEGLSELQEGTFVFEFHEQIPILRAADPVSLYLAAKEIASLWPTADYGFRDGQLKLTSTMCADFSQLDVGANTKLSVMSQNLRCADDGNGNDIDDRKVRFQKLMAAYEPDLLGTQETTLKWNEILEEYFGDEYGMVGCSRDGEKATTGEWNTILYKKSRFDLLDSGTFWLTSTPDSPSFTEGALCRRICTWVILKDKLTDKEIFFANTHLDHSNDTVRGIQAEYLMNFLAEYADDYPMYLTGDFNTVRGNLPYEEVTDILEDAHKKADVDESTVEGTFTGYGKPVSEIDFCFYNKEKSDAAVYRILNEKYSGFVSDHFGVIAYFTFK